MLKANYHTHTWRCRHADGSERQYVENAIKNGLQILGFSDHTPMPFDGWYRSTFRMDLEEFDGYVRTVLDLKEEYRNEIEIRLGVEAEYYPKYFEKLQQFLGEYPVEYMLLGQHFLGNEENDFYCGSRTRDEVHLQRYCEQTCEALRTGKFACLAHPDLLHYVGDKKLYRQFMRQLCETAKAENIPLEINCLGILGRRHYPNDAFWKIAGEVGNTVILGLDAHSPEQIINRKAVKKAYQIIERNQLTVLDKLGPVR